MSEKKHLYTKTKTTNQIIIIKKKKKHKGVGNIGKCIKIMY